jgi:Saxitoxin biosynthesis operon protein SxtJ
MNHAIPELDRKGLREFGLTTGGILAALFGVFFPWLLSRPYPLWPWIIAGVLVGWALAAPATLRTFHRLWMRLALLLNRITTPVVMAAVYFLVITPLAFIMRIAGRDPMAQRFDANAKSYRIAIKKRSKDHMERPF